MFVVKVFDFPEKRNAFRISLNCIIEIKDDVDILSGLLFQQECYVPKLEHIHFQNLIYKERK